MKYIFSTILLAGLSLFFISSPVKAAQLFLKTDLARLENSGSGRIDLLLDSPTEKINALGGEIVILAGQAELSQINDGQSIISAWLDRPNISKSGSIIFSGIIPGGFSGLYNPAEASLQPGLIMSFNVRALNKGLVSLGFKNLEAYFDQGEKAQITNEAETLGINFKQSGTEEAANNMVDKSGPSELDLQIIKLPDTLAGWSIIFSAQDVGSGIDHYEIQESLTSEPVSSAWQVATSPMYLKDQTRQKYVFVKAVDRQGNETVAYLPPAPPTSFMLYYKIASIILILAVFSYFIYLRRKNKS